MRPVLIGLLLVAPLVPASGQGTATGMLAGRVVDAQTGVGLHGAELIFAQARVTSDSSGKYRFTQLPGGVHVITVRRVGYEVLNENIAVIVGAESDADFRLTRIVALDTVRTTAFAITHTSPALQQFEERRKVGIGKFIDERAMRANDNRTLGNTLKRLPGIRVSVYNTSEFVSSSRSSTGGRAGAFLGGSQPRADPNRRDSPRGCWVAVYMDGLMLYNGDTSQQAPDLSKIQVRDLAGAEFYAGSASLPAQFSAIKSSDCGVLLLWSRER